MRIFTAVALAATLLSTGARAQTTDNWANAYAQALSQDKAALKEKADGCLVRALTAIQRGDDEDLKNSEVSSGFVIAKVCKDAVLAYVVTTHLPETQGNMAELYYVDEFMRKAWPQR